MRVVLVVGLFSVGVELPCAYMKEHAKGLLVMVVPTMAFGWVVVSGASLHVTSSIILTPFPLLQPSCMRSSLV